MAVFDTDTLERLKKPEPTYYVKEAAKRERMTNWKKLAAAVTKRDGKHCRSCGALHALDLHHILMRSLGGADEKENLVWVCRDCHRAIHGHALKVRWAHGANRARSVRFEWV